MEIVIENPSADTSAMITTQGNPLFPPNPSQNRPYRPAYVSTAEVSSPTVDYYKTLQAPRPRSRLVSPEPDFEASTPPLPTTLRRIDRSGLLEIAELEPQRNSCRTRLLTGPDNSGHSGTLTRRIDRSGLLEAVPEVPDQCQNWKSTEKNVIPVSDDSRGKSLTERQLTGAEIDKTDESLQQNPNNRQQSTSPRISRSLIDTSGQPGHRRSSETLTLQENCRTGVECRNVAPSPTNLHGFIPNPVAMSSSVSSPYLRRYPGGSPTSNLERPTPVTITPSTQPEDARNKNRNSFTCVSPSTNKFLPIDSLPPRNRQSHVDLTGASYTRSTATSPLTILRSNVDNSQTSITDSDNSRDKRQQPDCLGRLSPRLRSDGTSPLTMSAIPDVIEAHGSRSLVKDGKRDGKNAPEGERAEAEGCEHSAGESLEETRVSFKPPNKILHNDNIQTLRVIILSEQL